MGYLVAIPSFLCGLAVSIEDIRCRRVPRRWILAGCASQLACTLAAALWGNNLFLILQTMLFAILCAIIQIGLALIKPGTLGFGDVTATLMMGLAVGMHGLWSVVMWWMLMGILGLAWILLWRRFNWQHDTAYADTVPFAPVIVCSAVIVVLATA